jgi:hypothetical protein
MSIATIRTAIKTTLETIATFEKVHKYEPKRFDILPAASIFFDGFEQRDLSIANNEATYRFMVRVAIQLQDEEDAQIELDDLVESVITTVAADRGLGTTGQFYNALVTTGDVLVIQNHNNAQMVAELSITADGLVSRT